MLPSALQLEIVTPERELVSESVDSAQLPGLDGELGILPGHAPLITELGLGLLTFRQGANTGHLAVLGGFAEVLPDRVSVLAEIAEHAEEIDVKRAEAARERAQKRLAAGGSDVDWNRAAVALQRALVRLQVASLGAGIPHPRRHRDVIPPAESSRNSPASD
jgi:F-type H+-transporting ATPase subunit epsilon